MGRKKQNLSGYIESLRLSLEHAYEIKDCFHKKYNLDSSNRVIVNKNTIAIPAIFYETDSHFNKLCYQMERYVYNMCYKLFDASEMKIITYLSILEYVTLWLSYDKNGRSTLLDFLQFPYCLSREEKQNRKQKKQVRLEGTSNTCRPLRRAIDNYLSLCPVEQKLLKEQSTNHSEKKYGFLFLRLIESSINFTAIKNETQERNREKGLLPLLDYFFNKKNFNSKDPLRHITQLKKAYEQYDKFVCDIPRIGNDVEYVVACLQLREFEKCFRFSTYAKVAEFFVKNKLEKNVPLPELFYSYVKNDNKTLRKDIENFPQAFADNFVSGISDFCEKDSTDEDALNDTVNDAFIRALYDTNQEKKPYTPQLRQSLKHTNWYKELDFLYTEPTISKILNAEKSIEAIIKSRFKNAIKNTKAQYSFEDQKSLNDIISLLKTNQYINILDTLRVSPFIMNVEKIIKNGYSNISKDEKDDLIQKVDNVREQINLCVLFFCILYPPTNQPSWKKQDFTDAAKFLKILYKFERFTKPLNLAQMNDPSNTVYTYIQYFYRDLHNIDIDTILKHQR